MKKIFFALCSILIIGTATMAQTADEIMAKAIDARGGAEKLNNLKAVVMQGNVSAAGMDIPMKSIVANKRGYRMELDIMGQTVIVALDGTKGWTINPLQGGTTAEDLPEDQTKGLVSQTDLADFANYKKDGFNAELLGKEKIDSKDIYKIKISGKNNIETTHWVDSQTYYVVKTAVKITVDGKPVETERKLSDYKIYDGLAFPTTTETTHPQAGQLITTITKVEINPNIDEAVFVKPKN